MKKIKTKTITMGVAIAMLLTVLLAFSGCGGDPANLEEYVANNEDVQKTLDSYNTSSDDGSSMTVTVEDNTIVYTYQYATTYTSDVLSELKTQLESAMASSESTFTSVATSMEDETGIKNISVRVVYLNGDDEEIYSVEY